MRKTVFAITTIACCLFGSCKQQRVNTQSPDRPSEQSAYDPIQTVDSIATEQESPDSTETEELSWEAIPDGPVKSLDFEKWLTVMRHIHDNYFARPTARMLADVGLEAMYETDDYDEDSIKSVHFIYGRQLKSAIDSEGQKYFTFDGPHAVMFEVFAYTSSGAQLHFRSPSDLKDFMQQAVKRGLAVSSGSRYIVCEKPLGSGLHKVKYVYRPEKKREGTYQELYYLIPDYNPKSEWQTCHVTLDFLRHWLEVE